MPNLFELPEFKISVSFKQKPSERITVHTSKDVAAVCRMCFDADTIEWTESFIVIALNRANKVIGFYKVSQGGMISTVADPRVIMTFALHSTAVSLILCHNHPSGNLKPSKADEEMTKKIKEAAQLFDIQLLDHIILTSEGYYSFADECML